MARQPRLQYIFLLQQEGKKEAMRQFKQNIKICQNRGNILYNKLRNGWKTILKILTLLLLDV